MIERKKTLSVIFIAQAAIIAALYVVMVMVLPMISSGPIQARIAEALTVLAAFTPAAIPGLTIGCLLANILTGGVIVDVICGTAATLIGAIGTWLLRKNKYLAPIPPILANAIIIPWVIKYAYGDGWPIWLLMITVGVGEIISCGVLGLLLVFAVKKLPFSVREKMHLNN